MNMRYNTRHRLVGAVVDTVVHSDGMSNDIHMIIFNKGNKKLVLEIEGWECETNVKPYTLE